MPSKKSRANSFVRKQSKIGRVFKTAKPPVKPGRAPRKPRGETREVATLNIGNVGIKPLLSEISRRMAETDDVLVCLQSVDLLEGLELIDNEQADLLSGLVEHAFDQPEIDLDILEQTINQLNSSKHNSAVVGALVTQLDAIAENIQGRLDGIVQGGYTANEALCQAYKGAGVGAVLGGAVGAATGGALGMLGGPGGGGVGATIGGSAGTTGGVVVGGAVGVLIGWIADSITEASERKKDEKAKEEQQKLATEMKKKECFPPPIFFQI